MRVLIVNAYSARNRGDAGIVISMSKMIRDIYGDDVEIDVASNFYKENESYYNHYNLNSIPPIWDIGRKLSLPKKIFILLKFLILNAVFKMDDKRFKVYDFVLSAGGGYVYSSVKGSLGVGYVNSLLNYWYFSTCLKKNVIAFPQSVGPLNSTIDLSLCKYSLKNVSLFFSRDVFTDRLFDEKLNLNYFSSLDIAFYLHDKNNLKSCVLESEEFVVGITVIDFKFARKVTDDDLILYVDKINAALMNIKDSIPNNLKVKVFTQVNVEVEDSDYEISKFLATKLQNVGVSVEFVDFDESLKVEEIIESYSKCDLFIGSRLHSAIFSLNSNTPTIGLAYQPKTVGTFERVGAGKYCLDIEGFSSKDLSLLIHDIYNNGYNKNIFKMIDKEMSLTIGLIESVIKVKL
ncbi:MAG: colanic acid/amylovoran biosynthesis protein [Oceanospirillaceae bacterium]|jgi:colanic acid/amylovoran biosynthesis protein